MGCEPEIVTAKEIAKEVVALLEANITTAIHCCPVCEGRGFVIQGFYCDCSPSVMLPNNREQCRACRGVGYLKAT